MINRLIVLIFLSLSNSFIHSIQFISIHFISTPNPDCCDGCFHVYGVRKDSADCFFSPSCVKNARMKKRPFCLFPLFSFLLLFFFLLFVLLHHFVLRKLLLQLFDVVVGLFQRQSEFGHLEERKRRRMRNPTGENKTHNLIKKS